MASSSDILAWISTNRPEWLSTNEYKWLASQVDGAPQTVLDTMYQELQSSHPTNIQQFNTDFNYNLGNAKNPTYNLANSGFSEDQINALKDYFSKNNISIDEQNKIVKKIENRYGGFSKDNPAGVDLTRVAQDEHWNNMSWSEKAAHPKQGDWTSISDMTSAMGSVGLDLGGLTAALKKVQDPGQLYYNLQQIKAQWEGSGDNLLNQSDIDNLTGGVNSLLGGSSSSTATPAAATGTVPTGPQTDYWNFPGAPTANDWASLGAMMGGTAATAQAAYQAAVSNFQNNGGADPGSATQWFDKQLGNVQWQFAPVLKAMNAQYMLQSADHSPMPLDLQLQMVQQILKLQQTDPTSYNDLISNKVPNMKQAQDGFQGQPNEMTSVAATLTGAGFAQNGLFAGIYNNFTSALTAQDQSLITQNIQSDFRSVMMRDPSPSELNAMKGMTPQEIQIYIDGLPSTTHPGMTTGMVNQSMNNIKSIFEAGGVDATPDQVRMMAGWTKEQIQAWFDSQPSVQNPSMTNGQRATYQSMGDKISEQLFGTPMDNRMLNLLHAHINPEPMPKPIPAPATVTPTPPATPTTPTPVHSKGGNKF